MGCLSCEPTSRLRIRSCTRFITLAIVASTPPSAFAGSANAMGVPLRRRPRESSKLLIYEDAVCRFFESMVKVSKGLA